ncbi:MAG: glycosyltransferase family 1 protein [Hydrogenophaga sp.]|nr:glycosyltransferase family 1 protein [Hydrogenophaga sp.]
MNSLDAPDILLQELSSDARSMRLAVVTETWPPEVNGVAMTLARLVTVLCQRKHQVQLVRPRQTRHDADMREGAMEVTLTRGMPIPRYPQLKLGLPARKALVTAWTVRRPDLVHIATEGPLGWSALKAARQLKIPVTSDFRTNFHSYSHHYGLGWLNKPIAAYLRKFHNQTQCTMAPTRALCADLMSQGFERVQVVSRGVDTQLFRPELRDNVVRAQWGAGPADLVMLVVGRLAPEKNLDLILRAHELMGSAADHVRLVFVGDGPLRESFEVRYPRALFVGSQRHADLARSYASADLLLFPSLTETFGNVTLEALASGLPVLAFDCAAAAELIQDGHNGWLVPPGDSEAFVRAVVSLAQAPHRLAGASAAARASVASMAWDQIAEQVEAIFERAIEAGCRSRAAMVPVMA